MKEKTDEKGFEEAFPELENKQRVNRQVWSQKQIGNAYVDVVNIKNYCLSKQRVKEAIIPYLLQNKDDSRIKNILKNICYDLDYKEEELGL